MRLKTIIRNIFWGIVLATTLGTQVNFAAEDGTNIMDESVTELKKWQRYYIADADGLLKLSNLQAAKKVKANTTRDDLKLKLDETYQAYRNAEDTNAEDKPAKWAAFLTALANTQEDILTNNRGAYIYLITDIDISGGGMAIHSQTMAVLNQLEAYLARRKAKKQMKPLCLDQHSMEMGIK